MEEKRSAKHRKTDGKYKRLGFRINDEQEEMFDYICQRRGVNKSQAFDEMLRSYRSYVDYVD